MAGTYLRGCGEIERARRPRRPFRNSALTTWPQDTRSLGINVIITHARCELYGNHRDPRPVRRALMRLLIVRRGSQWKIIAVHDTHALAPPG